MFAGVVPTVLDISLIRIVDRCKKVIHVNGSARAFRMKRVATSLENCEHPKKLRKLETEKIAKTFWNLALY